MAAFGTRVGWPLDRKRVESRNFHGRDHFLGLDEKLGVSSKPLGVMRV
jgi:hypothetical protein